MADRFNGIKVVGFDADDTLWENERYYRSTEDAYASMLSEFLSEKEVKVRLFKKEMENLPLFGYGIKPFVISMIENAIEISGGKVDTTVIKQIIASGRRMMEEEVELLNGVEEVLKALHGNYRLIVATKGDLLDQERKLTHSGLESYFHHIEVMSDKTPASYGKLLRHLEIEPEEFVMIGNSLRSDILAPVELGCSAIYVPHSQTWQHELDVDGNAGAGRYIEVKALKDVLNYLNPD